jgi:hypothetical protein
MKSKLLYRCLEFKAVNQSDLWAIKITHENNYTVFGIFENLTSKNLFHFGLMKSLLGFGFGIMKNNCPETIDKELETLKLIIDGNKPTFKLNKKYLEIVSDEKYKGMKMWDIILDLYRKKIYS